MRAIAVALVLALTSMACTPQDRGAMMARPPNILVIVTDDQRFDSLDVMQETTRRFVEEGTNFTRAFAVTPQCCPSRASIFSGRYPHNHGVLTNDDADRLDEGTTVQSYLRDSGYRTAIVGKHLNRPGSYGDPELVGIDPEGFDDWAIFLGGYEDPLFNVDGDVRTERGYSTEVVASHAVGLLGEFAEEEERPWLLYVTPFAPHAPFITSPRHSQAPVPTWRGNPAVRSPRLDGKPPYLERGPGPGRSGRKVRREQLRMLLSVDDMVAEIFEVLQATGQDDSTLAVYTSDQGHMWGEHGIVDKAHPYIPSVRIPLLLRWPGHVEEGKRDDRLVSNVDLAPTFLLAAEVPLPEDPPLDGRSLLDKSERDRVLLQHAGLERIDMPPWSSLVTHEHQYTEYYDAAGTVTFREYYDLSRDRWQLHNLLADGGADGRIDMDDVVEQMSVQLALDGRCQGRTCP